MSCLSPDSVRPLVSPSVQQQLCAPSSSFEMTFDLSLAPLCADFREDIDFRFSLGWTALVTRFVGATGAHRALAVPEVSAARWTGRPAGRAADTLLCLQDGPSLKDRLVVSMATGLVSVSSRASMAVLLIGGVVSPNRAGPEPSTLSPGSAGETERQCSSGHIWTRPVAVMCVQVWRSVGWRVVALSVSLYGLLYLYERLTWTASSQERALKQQFTEFAALRLRAVVPVTSSACSQQVFK